MFKYLLAILLPLLPLSAEKSSTIAYRIQLQRLLKEKQITSVVDLGCGDWQFSKMLNWSGIHYIGVDVIPTVVQRNNELYGTPLIQFVHLDATKDDLPAADLLICKDVLQHLSDSDIQGIIPKLSQFRYCLLTNDYCPFIETNYPYENQGGYRKLDLTKPPFNLAGELLLEYKHERTIKRVLLITNQKE